MRGADNPFIADSSPATDRTAAEGWFPLLSAVRPFIADDAELVADLPSYRPLQNIACENPDTLRGTFSGAELIFHSQAFSPEARQDHD